VTQIVRTTKKKLQRVYVSVKDPAAKQAQYLTIYGATVVQVVRHLRESAGRIGISNNANETNETDPAPSVGGNGTPAQS
jgi:hypothetical protein